jgi:hypothetical protein
MKIVKFKNYFIIIKNNEIIDILTKKELLNFLNTYEKKLKKGALMKLQQALDGEFYNLEKAVKIVFDKGLYKATFEVPIRLGKYKNDTYIQKVFENLEIPEQFKNIDVNLYINFNKILKVTFFDDEDFVFLTSNTKKIIGNKFINYNIKATGKNDRIKKFIEGGGLMWIQYKNSFYNLKNVTNIFLDYEKERIILNFINSATNKVNVEDIKPEYETEFMSEAEIDNFKEKILKLDNWIQVNNKLVNLENVYNAKILPTPQKKIIFLNFVSNVTKIKDGEKIISTEFIKFETENKKEFEEFLNKLKLKV